ncbi:MAG: GyrI-like domain-containing protein [Gordonia sp. (in: high G+C Gram-positive bacteria)]
MSTDIPLVLREAPFFDTTEITVPSGVLVVSQEFPEVGLDDLRDIFDSSFGTLAQHGPVGPGYAIYRGEVGPDTQCDLEIGFPVAQPAELDSDDPFGGDVQNAEFPAGRALAMSHIGGFDGLGSAWESLMTTHFARGGQPPSAIAEIYVTDPSVTEQEDLRTDLLVLY